MDHVLFWIRSSHPRSKCNFQVIFGNKKQIVSPDDFEKICRDAEFLNYPVICLN